MNVLRHDRENLKDIELWDILEFDEDLVCDLFEYFGNTLKHLTIWWAWTNERREHVHDDRYSAAISNMTNLESLQITHGMDVTLSQMHMICSKSDSLHVNVNDTEHDNDNLRTVQLHLIPFAYTCAHTITLVNMPNDLH
jgi:hypothetical protein